MLYNDFIVVPEVYIFVLLNGLSITPCGRFFILIDYMPIDLSQDDFKMCLLFQPHAIIQ